MFTLTSTDWLLIAIILLLLVLIAAITIMARSDYLPFEPGADYTDPELEYIAERVGINKPATDEHVERKISGPELRAFLMRMGSP